MTVPTWIPVLAVLALTGCSSPPKNATPARKAETAEEPAARPVLEPGMTTVSSIDGSFTLAVPENWAVASSKDKRFADAVRKAGQPGLLKQIDDLAKQSYFRVMVMDIKGIQAKAAFVDNLNVVALPADDPALANDMKAAALMSARQVFQPGTYSISVIETPNGKVGKYAGPTGVGSGVKHDLIGGVLIHDGEALTVSLSTRLGNGKNLNKTFNTIVNSIRFK